MSSKNPSIYKSKTLDVPIIITNDYDVSSTTEILTGANTNTQSTPLSNLNTGTILNTQITQQSNKFQKGYSLDSQYLYNQNSLSSSSSLINDLTSSSNSISSSSNSIQHHRQFLEPPSSLSSSQVQNINADFTERQLR